MPEPVRDGQRYLPGLDGLRALAVLGVVAYHLGLGWAPGGLLGAGVFFTLSGYLITGVLLHQYARTGSLQLAGFWRGRARRLLPALVAMLAVVTVWVALLHRSQLPALRGAVAAALAGASNWWQISQPAARPGPLTQLWALAVTEQFYLAWPLLMLLGLAVTSLAARRRRAAAHAAHAGNVGRTVVGRLAEPGPGRGARWGLGLATLALAAGSAVLIAAAHRSGASVTRLQEGTDTRALALLAGAALAFAWPIRRQAVPSAAARWLLDGLGAVGLAALAILTWRLTARSAFGYPAGPVLAAAASAAVIAAVVVPGGRLGALLGAEPLRWLGVRSYGICLWCFPVIALTTPPGGRESLARAALQVAAAIAAAALSWHFIEEPVRHGALGRWRAGLRAGAGAVWGPAAGVAAVLALSAACLAGVVPALPRQLTGPAAAAPAPRGAGAGGGSVRGAAGRGAGQPVSASERGHTSCQSVADIGDSTSEGMVSADYLPDKAERLGAQYARVGVQHVRWEISGARSIVETFEGHPNAATVARRLTGEGYQGCWVLALGTNDTADVYVGSPVSLVTRIRQMMAVIGGQPVLWVNVISLLSSGPYAEYEMQKWNTALLRACARYPNMRVYDWAAAARPKWFISDGIHYTSAGYAARARLIARALAAAFPAGAGTGAGGCVVR